LDSVTDVAIVVGLVRDIVLLLLLGVALITFLMVIRKILGLLSAASRTVHKAEEMFEAVSEKVIQPATSNPRGMRMAARAVGFLVGMVGGRKRKGDKDDGQ
jgi:hypothetical protein